MADLTVYKCNYCGRKFKNQMDARIHEIKEKVAHNQNPIYTLSISFSLTNLCFNDHFDLKLFREYTWEENGKQMEYWKWYSTDFDKRIRPFDESIGKWIFCGNYNSKEIGDLQSFLREYLENRCDDSLFDIKIHFYDWNDLKKYLDEFKSALPDKEWLAKYREYFQKVFSKDLKDDICKTSEVIEEAVKNSNGKWALVKTDECGYGSYEVKRISNRIGLRYGIQEPADIDLLVWLRRK